MNLLLVLASNIHILICFICVQIGPRSLEVQPWAADIPSFAAELDRIVTYITRPQVDCTSSLYCMCSQTKNILPPEEKQLSHQITVFEKVWKVWHCVKCLNHKLTHEGHLQFVFTFITHLTVKLAQLVFYYRLQNNNTAHFCIYLCLFLHFAHSCYMLLI